SALQQSLQPLDLRGEGIRAPTLLLGMEPLLLGMEPLLLEALQAGRHWGAGGSVEQPQHQALWPHEEAEVLAQQAAVPVRLDRLVAALDQAEALEARSQVLAFRVEQDVLPHAQTLVLRALLPQVLVPGVLRGHLEDDARYGAALTPGEERPA